MIYLSEILFLVAIMGIAYIQARMISAKKAIHHGWWDVIFGSLIGVAWWASAYSYFVLVALVTEHFIFFPPFLNFFRTPREPFFYIHSDPKKGSIWDRLLAPIDKYYPYLWGAIVVGFIILQFEL